jgi:hypothetical protein
MPIVSEQKHKHFLYKKFESEGSKKRFGVSRILVRKQNASFHSIQRKCFENVVISSRIAIYRSGTFLCK